jgi:hypothetical protein
MNQKHEPKISLPEALIAGPLLFGIPDLIELLLGFFGIDTLGITDAIAFPGSQIYLRMKGVKSTYALMGNILELIPYVGVLPLRTIGYIAVVWLDHHPKAEAAIGAAAGKATSGEKLPAGGVTTAGKTPLPAAPTTAPSAEAGKGVATSAPSAGAPTTGAPAPQEELFSPPKGPIEKLQAELEKTRPLPNSKSVVLDEHTNTVDLRQAA